jgi:glucokinase
VSPDGPGAILALVRADRAITRQALITLTGLSRSTIAQRLEVLLSAGYLAAAASAESSGGRPAGAFRLNPDFGVLLIAAVSADGMHIGLADAAGTLKQSRYAAIDIADGPETVLACVDVAFKALLKQCGHRRDEVCGIGIGVPGPVAFREGRVVRPPIMKGWDDYRIADYFATRFDAVVMVDNDANLMALGEHRLHFRDVDNLMYLTVGTGVGAGLIMSGSLQRGAVGAAGDLGHWFVPPKHDEAPQRCRCGNVGCLEAYASGWALLRDLRQLPGGKRTALTGVGHLRDAMALAEQGEPTVLQMLTAAGERIGDALTLAVNLLNPAMIVVGGEMVHDRFLAALRQAVYRGASPLATRDLQIIASPLGELAALQGVAQMMVDTLFAPEAVDRRIADRTR